MKSHSLSSLRFQHAPDWAERALPRVRLAGTPALILLQIPDEEAWIVASTTEVTAIANPDSLLGRIMRPHATLLPLHHLSRN